MLANGGGHRVSTFAHRGAAQGCVQALAHRGSYILFLSFLQGATLCSHAQPQGGMYRVPSLAHIGRAFFLYPLMYQRLPIGGLYMYSTRPHGAYATTLTLAHREVCLMPVLTHGGGAGTAPYLYSRPQGTVQVYVQTFAHRGDALCRVR